MTIRFMILTAFSALFVLACGETQTIEGNCNNAFEQKVTTSKNPFHLTLAIIEHCGHGNITLFTDGHMLNQVYELDQISTNKVLYDYDFYSKELVVKYEPGEGEDSGVVRLRTTFH